MFRKLSVAAVLALVGAVIVFGVVYAITITVDGNREAAWGGSGGQTPGNTLPEDPDEAGINNNVDIQGFQWTNDGTYFYFLVDVWATAPLMPNLAPIDICLNTDNNAGTTIPATNAIYRNRCSYGSGVTGIDTVIEVYRTGAGPAGEVLDVSVDPPNSLGAATLGYNPAATTPVVEIRALLTNLGVDDPSRCIASIPMVVYYDGGDTNPDDNLPNSGTTSINCGTPTAVTLNNLEARPADTNTTAVVILAVTVVLAFGVVGTLALRRRQHTS